jgi:hypothetical protein
MDILKLQGGFNFNEIDYTFQDFESEQGLIANQIVSESQVLVGTTDGIILLDLSCTIEGETYTDINLFVQNLY